MATKKSTKKTIAAKKAPAKPSKPAKKAIDKKDRKDAKPAAQKPGALRPTARSAASPVAAKKKAEPTRALPVKKDSAPVKASPASGDPSLAVLKSLNRIVSAAAPERARAAFQAAREHLPLQRIIFLRGSGRHRTVAAQVSDLGLQPAIEKTGDARSPYGTLELPDRSDGMKEIPFQSEGDGEACSRRGLAVPFDLESAPGEQWHALWIFEDGAGLPSRKQAETAALFLPGFFPALDADLSRQLAESVARPLQAKLTSALADTEEKTAKVRHKLENELTQLKQSHERDAAAQADAQSRVQALNEELKNSQAELKTLLSRTEKELAAQLEANRAQKDSIEASFAKEREDLRAEVEMHAEEAERLRADLENKKKAAEELTRSAAAQHEANTREMQAEHARLIEELHRSHEEFIRNSEAAHEEKIKSLSSSLAGEIESLQKKQAEELQSLEEKHASDLKAKLVALKEELHLEIQLREEEVAKLSGELTAAHRRSSEELESTQKDHAGLLLKLEEDHLLALEASRAELTEGYTKEIENLKAKLEQASLNHRDDSKKIEANFAKEKQALTDRIASLEQSQASSVKKIKEEAQASYARLETKLKADQQSHQDEKKRTEETHRSLVEGLQNEIRSREEQIREHKEKAFALQELLDQTTVRLEQEKESHARTKEHDNERIARVEEESVLVAEDLNRIIKEREKSLQTAEQTVATLQDQQKNAQSEITEARQSIAVLQKEKEDLASRVQELSRKIDRDLEEHQSALAHIRRETEGQLLEASRNLEGVRSDLEKREAELKSRIEALHRTEQSLSQANQRITALVTDVEEGKQREIDLKERIDEIERNVEKTHQENRELHELMRVKNDEIRNNHMEEQKLRRSAQTESARAQELERLVETEKERLREKEEILHRRNDEITALNARSESLSRDIENYLGVLQQRKETIDTLRDELDASKQQVTNSRQEGHLMIEASRALSQKEFFEEKIDYLRERVLRDIPISRLVFYSIDEEEGLVPTFSRPSFAFAKTSLRLADTFFGQAFASQKPVLLKKKTGEDPIDLPRPDDLRFVEEDRQTWENYCRTFDAAKGRPESSLILPLVLGSRTEGVLVMGSESVLDEKRTDMTMLEHLAPFVATAYHEEKDRLKVEQLTAATGHLQTVRKFLEKRSQQTLLLARGSVPEQERASLEIKTRYIASLFELQGNRPTAKDIVGMFETIAVSLKDSHIFTEFHIDPKQLGNVIAGDRDLTLLMWLIGEAVSNVIEHSDARRLLVETTPSSTIPGIKIEDDGEGLIRRTGSMNPKNGLGFAAIQAMAALLNLELRVARGEGGLGTSIRLYRR